MLSISNCGNIQKDQYFMEIAITEAKLALVVGELPVGAVISHNGKPIAKGRNQVKLKQSNLAHAEIEAIKYVETFLYNHRFECDLYVTLEPCIMCFGAILNMRFRRLVIGAADPLFGFFSVFKDIHLKEYSNRIPIITSGLFSKASINLLKTYVNIYNDGHHLLCSD